MPYLNEFGLLLWLGDKTLWMSTVMNLVHKFDDPSNCPMGPEDQIIVPVEMGGLCNILNCSFGGKINNPFDVVLQ